MDCRAAPDAGALEVFGRFEDEVHVAGLVLKEIDAS
jgi:hypothetical protein